MSEQNQNKTPWRKNLDPRYISGEDLLAGLKGLKPEMVVTLAKYNDAPTFDQKEQKEVDKTAIWLKEYPSGNLLYKPCILNVTRGKFLSKEIGNDSLFIDDFDNTKPFVMYAKPDRRHGHVVAFKKYNAPSNIDFKPVLEKLDQSKTLDELAEIWRNLSEDEKRITEVIARKDKLKSELK